MLSPSILLADWVTTTIPAGDQPYAIAVNPVTNKIYVANQNSDDVTVIDGVSNITATLASGDQPYAIAVNPVTNKIYVANAGGDNITVIDGDNNNTTNVPAVDGPVAVVVNAVSNKIYVVNGNSGNVTVIDGATNDTTIVPVGMGPWAICVNPVTNKIYVVNAFINNVTVIDGVSNSTTSIGVGNMPIAIAVNPVTNKIYVANLFDNTVTVIDGTTNNVIATIPAATGPIAVNPVINKIYVANQGSNTVTVIDGYDNSTTNLAVGDGPIAVAVNPVTNKIYVARSSSDSVTVIHGDDNSTTSLAVGDIPIAVAVNPVTNKIYVANQNSDAVTVIDSDDNDAVTVVTGDAPHAVCVNPVTNKIYVPNFSSNDITVLDGDDNSFLTVTAGDEPIAVAVNPVTNEIYVANRGNDTVTVLDGATNNTVDVLVGNEPYAIVVNPATNKIYVANQGSNNVTVLDGATNNTVDVLVGNQPHAISVNPVTNKIYVANQGNDSVTVLDGVTNNTASVAVGTAPVAIAVNPVTNKIYVANQGSNNVTVLDGATNNTTDVLVGNQPNAISVNPVTNKIYVANNGNGEVTVIDGATNNTTDVIVGNQPYAIVVNPVTNKIYVANQGSDSVTVIDGTTNSTITVGTGSEPIAIAVNPVTNKIYVANRIGDNLTVIDVVNEQETGVIAEIISLTNNITCEAMPTISGKAVNRWDPNATTMLGAIDNWLAGQEEWTWTTVISGAGTDSINWQYSWGSDSLLYGENFINIVPLESHAGITNNFGLGTPFAGNMLVYPIYRLDSPLNSFSLISPSDSAMLSNPRPTFIWETSCDVLSGLEKYEVYIDNIVRHTGVDTNWIADYDLSEGWHNWYIVANDTIGNLLRSIETWSVLIDTTAPSVVSLISPSDGAYLNNNIIDLTWHKSVDNLSGVDHYILQYTQDITFSSGVIETTLVDTAFSVVLFDTTYYWRVKARDQATNESAWSSIWSFEIDTHVPNSPNLISPIDGIYLNNSEVVFEWSEVLKSGFGGSKSPIEYVLQVDTAISFSNPMVVDTGANTYDTLNLSKNNYYWRVKAYDLSGNESAFSGPDSFGLDLTEPLVPLLVSPDSGIVLNINNPIFVWHISIDDLSGIEDYVLQYSQDNTFSSGVIETTVVDTAFTVVLSDTIYYWRVKARDKATNESAWSSVWSFEIDTQTPNAPTLISPIGGIWLSDSLVTFEWAEVTYLAYSDEQIRRKNVDRESEKILGSQISYIIQVDTLFDFSSPLITDSLDETSTTLLLFEDFYYWRVKAFDLAGNQGPYTEPDSFGVDITAALIDSTTLWEDTSYAGPFEVRTKVTDNLSGIDSILLYYKRDEDPEWVAVTMALTGVSGWYADLIPVVSNTDDTVRYYIEAVDASEPANNATDPEGAPADYYRFIANHDVGVTESEDAPTFFSFGLKRNPTKGKVVFDLALPTVAEITLRIYDVSGRFVDKPISGRKSAGYYEIPWASNRSAGVYFYCLESPWGKKVGKLVLIR